MFYGSVGPSEAVYRFILFLARPSGRASLVLAELAGKTTYYCLES